MALKITLKPCERIIIDGAVVTNGNTTTDLVIENNIPILREKNIMSDSDAVTPCRRIYFVIQLMYFNAEDLETHHKSYWRLVRDLVQAAPSLLGLIEQISEHILNGEYYQALKIAKELINYEEEVLDRVQECAKDIPDHGQRDHVRP
ncbi:MAG: flagellar biosynthesis repressor FlbT [Deltaproteobacteria bacterium]|nr:flagellar biosynthesis repressor FlbT [Deltaproteobacteria bacterium]